MSDARPGSAFAVWGNIDSPLQHQRLSGGGRVPKAVDARSDLSYADRHRDSVATDGKRARSVWPRGAHRWLDSIHAYQYADRMGTGSSLPRSG